MKPVWVIAKNTYREIIRDRILYGLLLFAILLIAFSLVLGQLSFAEQARITVNFGFTAIQLGASILAVFVGSTLVAREIEKKTIMTLLVRPVTRTQFIVGKICGLTAVISTGILMLSAVLMALLFYFDMPLSLSFFIGLFGILIEAGVLLAVIVFFGSFASPMLSVSYGIGIFLIGHWVDSLMFFANKSGNETYMQFARIVKAVVPNLEVFNWRSLYIYNDSLAYGELGMTTVYGAAWVIFLTSVSSLILKGKDLG